jgi:uncharacterized protein (DUF1778 family)
MTRTTKTNSEISTIRLKSDDFDRFVAILESPPELSEEVKARLHRKPVWEKE